ncbi:peripherin-2-like [Littorina saxatilis]|uniref:Uncharacterized protein n=1 Tax=Littorina saxatilis TaxID=31220 RepID=A0AAN9BDU8_9CAEN
MKLHVPLTEKQRHQLSSITMFGGIAVMPLSVSLICTTFYIRFVVDDELDLVQGMYTATLPYLLAATGTINFLAMLLLVSSLAKTHYASRRVEALRLAFIAIIVAIISTLLVFAACIFCLVQLYVLPSTFEGGLDNAMQQYSKDPSVKSRLDVLHMEYECCGDEGFKDWFIVPWISEDFVVANPQEVQKKVKDGLQYTNDDVPFSCCNPVSPRPCIHHHVTTNYLHYEYDHHQNITLYTQGCRRALMDFFGHMILRGVTLSLLFMFFVQTAIIVAARLMQTSMVQAMKRGDMEAPAEGYIFRPREGAGAEMDLEQGALLMTDTDDSQYGTGISSEEEEQQVYGNPATDTETTTMSEGEPIYENIISEGEPIYENIISEPDAPFSGQYPEGEFDGDTVYEEPVPFPSEMAANQGQHNAAARNNSAIANARRRSSRAFNSLGIPPPQPPRHAAPPPPPPPPPYSHPPPLPLPPPRYHLHHHHRPPHHNRQNSQNR